MSNIVKFMISFVVVIFASAFVYSFYCDYTSDWSRVNRAHKKYEAGKISKEEYNFYCVDCGYPTWQVK